jgi:hypothetical protein
LITSDYDPCRGIGCERVPTTPAGPDLDRSPTDPTESVKEDKDDPGLPILPDDDDRDPPQPDPADGPAPPDEPSPVPDPRYADRIDDMIEAARRLARRSIGQVIRALDRGLSAAQESVLARWFPGLTSSTGRAELRETLQRMYDRLGTVNIRYISPGQIDRADRTDGASRLDAWRLHVQVSMHVPAATIYQHDLGGPIRPQSEWYIAVYQAWVDAEALQATRIVHEGGHLAGPGTMSDGGAPRINNPYCFQGLVSQLTGLHYNEANVSDGCSNSS